MIRKHPLYSHFSPGCFLRIKKAYKNLGLLVAMPGWDTVELSVVRNYCDLLEESGKANLELG